MNKVAEWRNKHPRCRYCKYYEEPGYYTIASCKAKLKYWKEPIYIDTKGMFCKLFVPKEVDED